MDSDYHTLFGASPDQARIDELAALIRKHRALYYAGTTEITDDEFDAYVDEIRDLDASHAVLTEVGAPVQDDSNWKTVAHSITMTSQDKVNTQEEMLAWVDKRYATYFSVEEKLDGGGLSFDYVNGVLQQVVTRGNGKEGEDITRNALKMRGVHRVLPAKFTGTLRAEVMFTAPEFKAYNERAEGEKGWRVFKNMRNGATGLSRRTSGDGVEYLRVFFYDLISDTTTFETRFDMLTYIRKRLRLLTPWYGRVDRKGLITIYNDYSTKRRAELPYEIDGLVVKVDDYQKAADVEQALQQSTRDTANPKSQVAWKFASETRATTVVDVVGDFGLGGRITPVAVVAPVKIGGVTVERASLHNWDMVRDLGIHVGGKVLIERANDVIPQVVKTLDSEGTEVTVPTHCPKCAHALVIVGKFLCCENQNCPGIIAGNIRKWVKYLEVDYFGMGMIEQLVEAGKLTNVADLYRLDRDEVAEICGAGMARRALDNLQAKNTLPLYLMVGALNIRSFGRTLAKLLVKAGYDTTDKLLAATAADFEKVDGFGEDRAKLVWDGLHSMEATIRDLESVVTVEAPKAAGGGVLAGKSVCITGSLSKPKKVFEQLIEGAGGEWHKSLKSSTDYLVAADPNGNSSKLKLARKRGTSILSEEELMVLLGG